MDAYCRCNLSHQSLVIPSADEFRCVAWQFIVGLRRSTVSRGMVMAPATGGGYLQAVGDTSIQLVVSKAVHQLLPLTYCELFSNRRCCLYAYVHFSQLRAAAYKGACMEYVQRHA